VFDARKNREGAKQIEVYGGDARRIPKGRYAVG
jgi:hypothetical protein